MEPNLPEPTGLPPEVLAEMAAEQHRQTLRDATEAANNGGTNWADITGAAAEIGMEGAVEVGGEVLGAAAETVGEVAGAAAEVAGSVAEAGCGCLGSLGALLAFFLLGASAAYAWIP